jgi:glycosyltransferase involved in cell wall biosynthesis
VKAAGAMGDRRRLRRTYLVEGVRHLLVGLGGDEHVHADLEPRRGMDDVVVVASLEPRCRHADVEALPAPAYGSPAYCPAVSPGRLRIAFLSFDYVEYCIPIANALARRADVCLLLPDTMSAHVADEIDEAVQFRPFRKPRLRRPLLQLRMCFDLVDRIRLFRPHVVHLQQGQLWFNIVLPLLRRRYPFVLTIHDHRQHLGDRTAKKMPQAMMDFGFRQADQIVVHASRLKRELVEQLPVLEDAVHVIPSLATAGIPDGAQDTDEEAGNVVLFFGRIWPYKGLDWLIRAEPRISAAVPDLRIVIAGEGENLDRYRRLMVHPERFVVHNDFVSNERRAELFAQASVVVLPYVEASQSGVVRVAYAFGKPVIATTVGGLPELVHERRTGLLVPPRDDVALAEAIIGLLRDRELRAELGANGRRLLEGELSGEGVAAKTLAVYEHAVTQRSLRRRPTRVRRL